jgi:hypothetical protein
MTQQEIQERNKQIALMLGAIYSEDSEAWGFGNARIETGEITIQGKKYKNLIWAERWEKELKFHSDGNLLMEAVEFIEGLKWFVTISGNECTVFNFEYKHTARGRCYNTLAPTKKEAVFIAVSDFAKLYNEGNYENF